MRAGKRLGNGLFVSLPGALGKATIAGVLARTLRLYGVELLLLIVSFVDLVSWRPGAVIPLAILTGLLLLVAWIRMYSGARPWPTLRPALAAGTLTGIWYAIPRAVPLAGTPVTFTAALAALIWIVPGVHLFRSRVRETRGIPAVPVPRTQGLARAYQTKAIAPPPPRLALPSGTETAPDQPPGRVAAVARTVSVLAYPNRVDVLRFLTLDIGRHLVGELARRHRFRQAIFALLAVDWIGEGLPRGLLPQIIGEEYSTTTRTLHVRCPAHLSVRFLGATQGRLADLEAAFGCRAGGLVVTVNPANAAYGKLVFLQRDAFAVGVGEVPTHPVLDVETTSAREPFPTGYDDEGNACDTSIADSLGLTGGSSGSGKSSGIHGRLATFLKDRVPGLIVIVDPKRVEFEEYRGIPGVIVDNMSDPERTLDLLRWTRQRATDTYSEMSRRAAAAREEGDTSSAYKNVWRDPGLADLAINYLLIDELSSLTMHTDEAMAKAFRRELHLLAKEIRAGGWYLDFATQQTTVDVIPSNIRGNIGRRFAYACTTDEQSVAITGSRQHPREGINACDIPLADSHRGVHLQLGDDGPVRKVKSYWMTAPQLAQIRADAIRIRSGIAFPVWPGDPDAPAARLSAVPDIYLDEDGDPL